MRKERVKSGTGGLSAGKSSTVPAEENCIGRLYREAKWATKEEGGVSAIEGRGARP